MSINMSIAMISQMNINSIPILTTEQHPTRTSAASSLVFVKRKEALTNA
jgi:hypothetical protein